MSFKAVHWALHDVRGIGGAKWVLVTLAEYANDDDVAWPKWETIAGVTESSKATVARHLKRLEEEGLILRQARYTYDEDGRTHRTSSAYLLHVGAQPLSSVYAGQANSLKLRPIGNDDEADSEPAQRLRRSAYKSQIETHRPYESQKQGVIVSPVSLINKKEPPIEPPDPTQPLESEVTSARDARVVGTGRVGEVSPDDVFKDEDVIFDDAGVVEDVSGEVSVLEGSESFIEAVGSVGLSEARAQRAKLLERLTGTPAPAPAEHVLPAMPPMPVEHVMPAQAAPQAQTASQAHAVPQARVTQARASGKPSGLSDDDLALLGECLPPGMQALDGVGKREIVAMLRERVQAGWKPSEISVLLAGSRMPVEVVRMAGLVRHRLEENVPVGEAPTVLQARASQAAQQRHDAILEEQARLNQEAEQAEEQARLAAMSPSEREAYEAEKALENARSNAWAALFTLNRKRGLKLDVRAWQAQLDQTFTKARATQPATVSDAYIYEFMAALWREQTDQHTPTTPENEVVA